jgi:hypothetical protein
MPLQQAHIVAEYMQGNFTVYDALEMDAEDFKQVYTVALAIKVANMNAAKKARKKKPGTE